MRPGHGVALGCVVAGLTVDEDRGGLPAVRPVERCSQGTELLSSAQDAGLETRPPTRSF